MINTYFQTETGGIIMANKYNESYDPASDGSIGLKSQLAYWGVEDANTMTLGTEWPGQYKYLIVNGENKYDTCTSRYFKMNDSYRISGNHIFIDGRSDEVIVYRGKNFGSGHLESAILNIENISEVAAIKIEDTKENDKLVIFYSLGEENKEVGDIENSIDRSLKQEFGTMIYASEKIRCSSLPKTKSGKILRRALKNILMQQDIVSDLSTMQNPEVLEEITSSLKPEAKDI